MLIRRLTAPDRLDLRRSLAPLVASAQDPTIRLRDQGVVRTSRTPDGPATIELLLEHEGRDGVRASAWGPGAPWALTAADGLLGNHEKRDDFRPQLHPEVARADRRCPGLRLPRTGAITDLLVPTILAQRVTAGEAARSWTRLVRRFGEPAPGPHGLRLPPSPAQLAAMEDWELHRLGVERARARGIRASCRRIDRLQETLSLPHETAMARLTSVAGIGPWTAALVLRGAAGHADAVEIGDYHVKNHVAWCLAGEPRASDERMLELLEPFAGHRGRVVRLLLIAGARAPTFGPRARVVPVEHL